MDNEKAAELADKIGKLLLEFRQHIPELNGNIEVLDDEELVEWNLHLDGDNNASIIIDNGIKVLSIDLNSLNKMVNAINFSYSLPIKQRKLLMDVLEYDSETT